MNEETHNTNLRDLFAGLAMQAIISNTELISTVTQDVSLEDTAPRRVAVASYRYADAMLDVRGRA